ncbi:hypothetical protein WAI453_000562 [Rhynchosporium graminicola]|uniref:Tr-type G domain-containing protein n=1 Tax=Rhynchosporium graminicola TaxID=2792576 RepID=A0A1E1JQS9_9HELO|nr:uncharacterized protein RCO7_01114 [Rhynchosporium commune]
MAPLEKTLSILGPAGAGKDTALGFLLFKLGGIDLFTAQRFERDGIKLYSDAVKDLQSRGLQLSFYTPNYHLVVSSGSSKVDCVILVIPTDSANVDFEKELVEAAGFSKSIIVLINKMDTVGWSEEVFRASVKSLGPATEGIFVIPFCALKGDNVLELSSKSLWYKNATLLEALETELSSS